MIVVSDTTPLISLLKIDRIDLLEKLFGQVLIPQAVLIPETLIKWAFPGLFIVSYYFRIDFKNNLSCSRCSGVSCEISFSNESFISCTFVSVSKNSFNEIPSVLQRTSNISTEGLE